MSVVGPLFVLILYSFRFGTEGGFAFSPINYYYYFTETVHRPQIHLEKETMFAWPFI